MGRLDPETLARRLAQGQRGGVFFLFGDDEFSREEAVSRVVDAHVDPATRDFNLDQLRGTELDPEALASLIATPPLMAEWRVIVVREAQALAGTPKLRAVIESVLDRPIPGLALVLSTQIPAGSKAKFYDTLRERAIAVEFPAVSAADLPGWLMARAESMGVELEPGAAQALTVAVGPNLGAQVQELEKLRDYVGERRRITRADVEAVVGQIPRHNRWEWIDMVAEGKFAEARAALPVLLDGGETGVGLVIGLGTHFLRLAIAAAGGERALQAELPPRQQWLARRLAAQARRWRSAALDAALDDLLHADRLLKSSGIGDLPILEELLLRLQARAAERVPA